MCKIATVVNEEMSRITRNIYSLIDAPLENNEVLQEAF